MALMVTNDKIIMTQRSNRKEPKMTIIEMEWETEFYNKIKIMADRKGISVGEYMTLAVNMTYKVDTFAEPDSELVLEVPSKDGRWVVKGYGPPPPAIREVKN